MINKAEWHKRYKQALMDSAGLTKEQAFHFLIRNSQPFDYGYSPFFYVKEEMACQNNFAVFKVCELFEGEVVI